MSKTILGLIALMLLLNPYKVHADMGLIVPQPVKVEEPGQTAFIAFNGQEEILLLGVDLKGVQSTSAIQFTPFPSAPSVELAPEDAFTRLQEVLERHEISYMFKAMAMGETTTAAEAREPVEVISHQKLSLHDVTVLEVQDASRFAAWVQDYFRKQGWPVRNLSAEEEAIVTDYCQRGLRYFVLDRVEINETPSSVPPLVFRFQTPVVYYPLKVTNLVGGYGEVQLIVCSSAQILDKLSESINQMERVGYGRWDESTRASIEPEELAGIVPGIGNLFSGNQQLQAFRYEGELSFQNDLWASQSKDHCWQPIGPNIREDYGVWQVVASPNFSQDQTLFAVAYQPNAADMDPWVFASYDGGSSWHPVLNQFVTVMGVSPAYVQDGTVIAASVSGRIFISRDRGQSWEGTTDIPSNTAWAIAFSPSFARDKTVFLGGARGLLVSNDGGNHWQTLTGAPMNIKCIGISPGFTQDRTLFAGVSGSHEENGLYRSTDGGKTWEQLAALRGVPVADLAFSPEYLQDRTLYALGGGNLFKSTDGGSSWEKISISGSNGYCLAISPRYAEDRTVFVGTETLGTAYYDGVVKCKNGLQERFVCGLLGKTVRDLIAVDSGAGIKLYAAVMSRDYRNGNVYTLSFPESDSGGVINGDFGLGELIGWRPDYLAAPDSPPNPVWEVAAGPEYAHTGKFGWRVYNADNYWWSVASLISENFTDTSAGYSMWLKLAGGCGTYWSGMVISIVDVASGKGISYEGNVLDSAWHHNYTIDRYFKLFPGEWREYRFDFVNDFKAKYGTTPGNLRRITLSAYQDTDYCDVYVDDIKGYGIASDQLTDGAVNSRQQAEMV